MHNRLTEKAQREIEELFALRAEAIQILEIINAEWQSDPQSVACFDLRIVKRTDKILKRMKQIDIFT